MPEIALGSHMSVLELRYRIEHHVTLIDYTRSTDKWTGRLEETNSAQLGTILAHDQVCDEGVAFAEDDRSSWLLGADVD